MQARNVWRMLLWFNISLRMSYDSECKALKRNIIYSIFRRVLFVFATFLKTFLVKFPYRISMKDIVNFKFIEFQRKSKVL